MSENVKCTHIPRVRVEVDHEGMDMSWLECMVCGNRLYVSEEPTDTLRTQLQEAQAEIAAKNTALGVDKVQLIEEIHRMEGEIADAQEKLFDAMGEIERLNEVRDALTEDSARAENARMEAEKGERIATYENVKLHGWLNTEAQENGNLQRKLNETRAALAAAEERIKDMEIGAENACRTVSRLTAEVEEWKKKAESYDVMMEVEVANLAAELSTLRRSSVRVDVLLRWMQSRSRILSILGGSIMSRAGSNPGEQAKALLSWLSAVLDKRQSRSTTNMKGE